MADRLLIERATCGLQDDVAETGARLRRWLSARAAVPAGAPWHRLAGGRSNLVWRVGTGPGAVVCKLIRPGAASPLFRNDPAIEFAMMRHLSPVGLAPVPLGLHDTPEGPCLTWRHLPGRPWRLTEAVAAGLLRTIHVKPSPPGGLHRAACTAKALRAEGEAMLADLPAAAESRLRGAAPRADVPIPPRIALRAPMLLHGDPVAANLIVGPRGAAAIDWQCPALGDPVTDLSLFLSPGMWAVYGPPGARPPDPARTLRAYGDPATHARFAVLRPILHWRMAVHCSWRAERGDPGFARAARRELAALARL